MAAVQAMLSGDDAPSRALAKDSLDRMGREQPALARYLLERLQRPLDPAALALGHMLGVAVYLAFETGSSRRLRALSEDAVSAADAAFAADEELRRGDPMDALDSEDIVAIEQPALVSFVNEHIGRTLDEHAGSVDVDHVAAVFRVILIEILALSHAVQPPPGHSTARGEPMA
jgi:hypothetical protein